MQTQDTLLSIPMTQIGQGYVLTFRLADQLFGLPVTTVLQIVEMVAITRLPQLPEGIQGAINVHGRIVPVLDLRLRFGLDCIPYHLHTPIVLTELNDRMLALVVDSVEEIVEMPPRVEMQSFASLALSDHQAKYIHDG